MRIAVLAALALTLLGCMAEDADVEDAVDAVADGHGLTERSAEAGAILSIVNDPRITQRILDEEAGLSARVANLIVMRRNAETIDDLAELDAIPYVGVQTLQRLASYAAEAIPTTSIASPTIVRDTTWSPSMGVIQLGKVHVPAGVTLTITAGTQLASPHGAFFVEGTLVVKGVRSAPVRMVGEGDDEIAWGGVICLPRGKLVVDHAVIVDAAIAVHARQACAQATLRDIAIHEFGYQAINAGPGATVEIDGALVADSSMGQALYLADEATMSARNVVIARTNLAIANEGTLVLDGATLVGNAGVYAVDIVNRVSSTTIKNSIMVGGAFAEATSPIELDRVLVWNTRHDEYIPAGANIVRADPMFAPSATAEFQLMPGSPAIDAGSQSLTDDLSGRPRVGAPDLGAYELAH
jgi:hypothetical protein